ncbi:YecA family protein [Xylophilus sp. Leaf220]|uniref:YecA/YgfB family protein n=1 Tax=Xylophilus sp. Leaf220 TaxID=1735686 RepID=UPI0006F4B136|nr:YecA family protein [Xylophilus sp. Leaf220]KQM69782.1 zinc chelation protein SecC [Xylophilus sp. Leaf220]
MSDTPDTPDTDPASHAASATALAPEDFDALDDILDELRTRDDEVPQWEFCEGYMAALVCCRRAIPQAEYLAVLLGDGAAPGADDAPMDGDGLGAFSGVIQQRRFLELWQRRWDDMVATLDTEVQSLDAPDSFQPEVLDVRGSIAALPPEERPEIAEEDIPSIAQVWALGFMYAVENWPEDWTAPRDKEAAQWLDESLQTIVALTEPDTGKPTISMFSEDGPPSVSESRLDAYGAAIWAVYDLRRLWKSIGPRVETVRRAEVPGRNDPCPCGSGKKYKKCHGA